MAAAVMTGVGGVLTTADLASLAEGVGKLLLPLLLFSYVSSITRAGSNRILAKLVIAINLFTIGQAILCKALTGEFAANIYYMELPEEYFGYFYHPFAFVGIVSACTIVVVNEFIRNRHRILMAILLVLDCAFIFQTEVRTYILATGVAFFIAFVGLTVGRKNPLATIVAALLPSLLILLLSRNLVAGSRATSDASSGRLDRWATDVRYVWETASLRELIVGGGPGRIFDINQLLFGVHINSLNAAIDIFVDFGLFGLVTVLLAWMFLVRDRYRAIRNPLLISVVVMLMISASVTNPLEFPAVGAVFVVSMLALENPTGSPMVARESNAHLPPVTDLGSKPRDTTQ